MSRCTKCNGKFIQKPLTTEEAVEAAKGFQVIPNCLFNKNIEFWQCMDCNQLYWEVYFSSCISWVSSYFPLFCFFYSLSFLLHNFKRVDLLSSDCGASVCSCNRQLIPL